jgi:serine/threonine protein kinase
VRVPTGSPPGKAVAPRRRTRAACKAAAYGDAQELASSPISSLPEECVVEVFGCLKLHPLLTAARVCRRWRLIAQDSALWCATRFTAEDGPSLLEQHFAPVSAPRVDHTGSWTRCERVLGRLRLMCRSVKLDYIEAGEGVSYRLLRSISCLQQLHHPTIVPLLLVNVDVPRNKLQLFYGDVGVSLEAHLKDRAALPMAEARCVVRQVLQALAHCHAQGITHRNLKPKYILLDQSPAGGALPGERWNVRLSDFNSVRWLLAPPACGEHASQPLYGAARVLGASSPTVVTLPYRAPEILLGCAHYTTAIDVWACGCVFAEAVSGSILFMADSDIGQLFRIFALLGTPGAHAHWPAVQGLPHFNGAFPRMRPADWSSHPQLAAMVEHPLAASLLRRMIALDPTERASAASALAHPFLQPDSPTPSHAATPPRMMRPISPPVSPPPRPLPCSVWSGGLPSGGLFGTPSSVGESGWVWDAWRRREAERALPRGMASWRAAGLPADEARESAALWLHTAACQFCRSDRSVHFAVRLLDHVLAEIPKGEVPLGQRVRVWAAASLLLACKFQEVETHTVEQLASFCKHEHSVAELLEAELKVGGQTGRGGECMPRQSSKWGVG